jgi:hypothetical protein
MKSIALWYGSSTRGINMAAKKTLEPGSKYAAYDLDGDGEVTDEEMAKAERMIQVENEDKKQDAQRNMAWFALFGMLLYPFAVVIASAFGLEDAGTILGNMAPTYFVSVAAIVAAFYGTQAYASKSISVDQDYK